MTTIPMSTMTDDPTPEPRVALAAALRRPLPLISLAVIVLVSAAVALAPVLAPFGPLAQDLTQILAGPSSAHPLGTDDLGRDVLSRLLYGGQPALLGVLVAIVVFVVVGMVLGILAGYIGGWVDRVISAVLDIFMSVPGIVIMLAVLAIFSRSIVASMFVLGLLSSANLARVIRSSCLAIREELFVAAATVSGLSASRIMFRHVLPGLVGQLVVQVSLFAGIALAVQTGLGFLGLATPAPAPSWGGMVGEASLVIYQSGYFLFVTGGTIALMTIAFGVLGDGIRDFNADSKGRASAVARRRPTTSRTTTDAAAPPSTTALLEVTDYSIAFDTDAGSRQVTDHISFAVEPGEIFGIVGESGSGKTVTALSLLGLLPSNGSVVSGHAWFAGGDLAGYEEREFEPIRGREIGLVSQEPMVALDPLFTVGSQLSEVVRRISGTTRSQTRAAAIELLQSVKLPDPAGVMRKYPHELSGGMVQRVVIAMALAGSPKLLIADEPTTALDVTVQAGILDLLRDLRERRGMTIILVTHDLGVVADICDRAIVMSRGAIVEHGSIDAIFYRPAHPYTQKLIESTPSLTRKP